MSYKKKYQIHKHGSKPQENPRKKKSKNKTQTRKFAYKNAQLNTSLPLINRLSEMVPLLFLKFQIKQRNEKKPNMSDRDASALYQVNF